MLQSLAPILKTDINLKDLEGKPSKSFFLTVSKKQLSYNEFQSLFYQGFPGWDNKDDPYIINHSEIYISGSNHYKTDLETLIQWMELNLSGKFHISGIKYNRMAVIQFQFKSDMELTTLTHASRV